MPDQHRPDISIDAVLERLAGRVGAQARDAAIAEAERDALLVERHHLIERIGELEAQLDQARPHPTTARPMPPESPDPEES